MMGMLLMPINMMSMILVHHRVPGWLLTKSVMVLTVVSAVAIVAAAE